MLHTLLRTSVRNFWALPLLVACAQAPLSPGSKRRRAGRDPRAIPARAATDVPT